MKNETKPSPSKKKKNIGHKLQLIIEKKNFFVNNFFNSFLVAKYCNTHTTYTLMFFLHSIIINY